MREREREREREIYIFLATLKKDFSLKVYLLFSHFLNHYIKECKMKFSITEDKALL